MAIKEVDNNWRDYNWVKDHLIMQLVPVKKNESKLLISPHRVYNNDFAVVYRVVVDKTDKEISSFLVNDHFLNDWGITEAELFNDALVSQAKIDPPKLCSLGTFIGDLMEERSNEPSDSSTWVATNTSMNNGASVILDPAFMDHAHEMLGDFYIIPSSIHECLFIKTESGASPADLEKLVREVNKNVVMESEYLSDTIYYYEDGVLMSCEVNKEEIADD